MKNTTALWVAALILAAAAGQPAARVRVVASSTNLASITEIIGGDLVEATSIARGTANPHSVNVLPS